MSKGVVQEPFGELLPFGEFQALIPPSQKVQPPEPLL